MAEYTWVPEKKNTPKGKGRVRKTYLGRRAFGDVDRLVADADTRAVLVEEGLLLLHELEVVGLEAGLRQRLIGRAEAVRVPVGRHRAGIGSAQCQHRAGKGSAQGQHRVSTGPA